MVDDNLPILGTTKDALENPLTTGLPNQSHYALEPGNIAASPPANLTIEHTGESVTLNLSARGRRRRPHCGKEK